MLLRSELFSSPPKNSIMRERVWEEVALLPPEILMSNSRRSTRDRSSQTLRGVLTSLRCWAEWGWAEWGLDLRGVRQVSLSVTRWALAKSLELEMRFCLLLEREREEACLGLPRSRWQSVWRREVRWFSLPPMRWATVRWWCSRVTGRGVDQNILSPSLQSLLIQTSSFIYTAPAPPPPPPFPALRRPHYPYESGACLRFIIMRAQKKVITPNQFGIIFGSPANMEIEDQLPLLQTKTKYSSHLRGCGGSGPSKPPLSGTHPPIQSCQYSSTNLFSHRITFRLALRWAKTHRIPKVKVQLFHPLARILAASILGSAGKAGQEAFIKIRTVLLWSWRGYYRYLGRRGAGGRHYAILFYLKAIRNRMKKDLTCILDGRNGRGAIYISGIDAAMCLDTLKEAHIQAVLSVARAALLPHSPAEVPRYLFLPAEDKETYNIAQHFDETFKFIDQARGHTNVLVHCMAGISRSATVIAAYLIRKWGYSVRGVLDLMQGLREKVCPNRGFIRQLKKIEPRRKQRTIVRKPDNEAASPSQVRSSSHSPSKNPKGSDCLEAERKMTESSFSSQLGDQDMVKFNRSQVIGKGCGTPKLSEAKTAAKIEKLKSSLIQDMLKSRLCPELPSQPQALSFSALLQSKIYKNKLRLRETAPQPIC